MRRPEAIAADWFHRLGLAGLLLSAAVFLLYGFGLLPGNLGAADAAELWHLSASEFREESGSAAGPGWFLNVRDGAVLSAAALALLAGTAVPVLAALSAAWYRRGDARYGSAALAIIAVLSSAAAGVL